MAETSVNSTNFVPARRTSFPVWVSVPALALVYGIGVPVTKLLEVFGKWPALFRKMPGARHPDFGTYRPDVHDVVACSYFKSGTNLLMQMAVQIAGKGRAEYDHIHDVVAWPDCPDMFPGYAIPLANETPWRTSPTGLRVIKTHKAASQIPITDTARYIAVVRDPKSVCVSAYHFTKALIFGPMMPSVENFAEDFMTPGFFQGDWAEHLAGFWAIRSRSNVLFMTYEEMTKDTEATARRVADFMEMDLSQEEIDAVVGLVELYPHENDWEQVRLVQVHAVDKARGRNDQERSTRSVRRASLTGTSEAHR